MNGSIEEIFKLHGFLLLSEIGHGSSGIVYKIERLADKKIYAAKVQKIDSQVNKSADLVRLFRREAVALARLRGSGTVKVQTVFEFQNQVCMVMDFIEGQSLESLLKNKKLSESEAILYISEIASAIEEAHSIGVIHRDIKPQNILISKNSVAKLIDFGFVVNESKKTENKNQDFFGTMQYSAPEQTGLLKRPIDKRSDLYSLGIVLYEIAVGVPPFESEDVGILAYKHLNEPPPEINKINPEISKGLQQIIYKLIAKDPDDRYQSADSLLYDLKNIATINQTINEGKSFHFGSHQKFLQHSTFVGRENELKTLLNHWEKVKESNGGVILVEGDPGMGKSRLLKETLYRLQSNLKENAPLLLSGKAIKGDSLPLTIIKDAIDSFIRANLELKSELEKNTFIEKFKRAAGELAMVIKALTPTVSKILNETNKVQENYSQDIYQNAIVEFIFRLSKEFSNGSLIFIVDDVQWIDDISNEIVKKLALLSKKRKILILGTCRGDIQGKEMLQIFLKELETINCLLEHVVLKPLQQDSIQNYIESKLNTKSVSTEVVAQLFQKSSGNPFATEEYLLAMLDSGFLKPSWEGSWILDETKINEINLPSDVVDLVIARLHYLSVEARTIFQYAAVMGSEFSARIIELTSDFTEQSINAAISEALEANLIERDSAKYKFVHDRIREALVAEINSADLKNINQKIAEKIDYKVNFEKIEIENSVYLLARHYSLGDIDRNPEKVYNANFEAALESLKNYANEEAYDFLIEALQVSNHFKLKISLEFYETIGEVCRITFKIKDAIDYFNKAIALSKSNQKRAHILGLISNTYLSGWEIEGAWKTIKKSFVELGRPLPESIFGGVVSVLYYMFLNETSWLLKLKNINEESKEYSEIENYVQLLNIASEVATFKFPLLIPLSAFRASYYASKMKDNFLKAKAFATVGMLYQSFKMKFPSDFYFKKAMDMAVRLNNRTLMAECTYLSGIGCAITGDYSGFEKYVNVMIDKYSLWVNSRFYFDQIYSLGWFAFMKGQQDKAVQICKDLILKSKNTKNSSAVYDHYQPAYFGTLLVMIGQVKEGMQHIQNMADTLEKYDPNPALGGDVYSNKIAALWELRDFGHDFEQTVKKIELLAPNPMFSMFLQKNAYICIAYIRFEQCLTQSNDMSRIRALDAAVKTLKKAVQDSNFFKAHVLTIEAGVCLLKNNFKKALVLLDEAEQISTEFQNNYSLFEACRMKARVLNQLKKSLDCQDKARQALAIAVQNKWIQRRKWIEEEFQVSVEQNASGLGKMSMMASAKATVMQSSSSLKESVQLKKHLDSLLQVTLASSQVFDPIEQVNIALDETIKVMSADRAFVFLKSKSSEDLIYSGGRAIGKISLDEPKGYSTTIIKKVSETKQPALVTGTEEGEALGSQSAVLHNLRSIMAVPLLIKDEFKGVLYIDSQLAKGIFTEDDTAILSGIGNHIAIAFESTRLANIEVQKQAMQKDLELSAAVQNLLLPEKNNMTTDKIELTGFYRPASNCSGDWWWFENDEIHKNVFIFSGDVTGHGAGPAMITATVASNFLTMRRGAEKSKLKFILEDMSMQLSILAKQAYLMSAFAVNFDFNEQKIIFYSAGGPQPVILKKNGTFDFLTLSGAPLGSVSTLINTTEKQINSGDRIFIFTDGIIEMKQENGRAFGERKLISIFKKYANQSVEASAKSIIQELDQIRGSGEQEDDYTLIICDIK